MTPPFVPASAPLSGRKRLRLWALGPLGFVLRALPGRLGVAARWDDVRDVLEDERSFATPYAGVESEVVRGPGLFTLGLAGDAHRCLRRRIETALDFTRAAPALADVARARMAAGARQWSDAEPLDFVGLAHAATVTALRPWLGLGGGGVGNAELGQWAMTLFEWQFAGVSEAALPDAQATARSMLAFVDDRLADARARQHCEGFMGALLAAGVAGDQARAWLVGVTVAALPQLPMAAARALNQLLGRPVALAQARSALATAGEGALWPFVQEALRFDPVAPAVMREVITPPAGQRFRAVRPGATVQVLLKSAMRDGRRVPRPGAFDAGRDASAWLGFGAGPHACLAQGLARVMLPAMIAPVLERGFPQRVGRMRAAGLAPSALRLRLAP